LRKDLDDAESRFFLRVGIRHNLFSKEERQNNPEALAGQALFYAWEVKHEQGLVNGILDFLEKPWGGGDYLYQFGNLPTLEIRLNEETKKPQTNYLEERLEREKRENNHFINANQEQNFTEIKKEKLTTQKYDRH
jgi:hypothetical protein